VPKNRQKIMAWGAIGMHGTVGLCLFQGIMDAKRYVYILERNLLPAAQNYYGNDWRFVHDNDPKHTAGVTKNFLTIIVPSVMKWPSNSPDLNPMENLWACLKKKVEKEHPANLKQLEKNFIHEWVKLDKNWLNKFFTSMKFRCEAIIASNGDHINY